MKTFLCEPIGKKVCLISIENHGTLKVLMACPDTGEFLLFVTVDVFTGRKCCACIDNKMFPWLPSWLVENNIGILTNRKFSKDNFYYLEFKFKMEEF